MSETPNNYDQSVEILIDDADNNETILDFILTESEKDEVLYTLGGDQTLINYMYLFEEFLEQHDIYLFKGWEKAQFVGQPQIEKFWAVFHLLVNQETDLRGAKRIKDAIDQGSVEVKKLDNGSSMVKFSILKRELDRIESSNQEKIEKLSIEALDEL